MLAYQKLFKSVKPTQQAGSKVLLDLIFDVRQFWLFPITFKLNESYWLKPHNLPQSHKEYLSASYRKQGTELKTYFQDYGLN